MQDKEAAQDLRGAHKERFGEEYVENAGLPLDWFNSIQQRHMVRVRTDDLPTMRTLTRRQTHYGVLMELECPLC